MPRFDDEDFRRNNDRRDRTVPTEENYYSYSPVDLNFNSREQNIVRDNQIKRGINPCDSEPVQNNYAPPPPPVQRFQSETFGDFAPPAPPKRSEPKNSGDGKKNKKHFHLIKSKKKRVATIILAVILAIILAVVGTLSAIMGKITYNEKKENTFVSASELESSTLVKNILLLGVDARAGENANETRSDTMMLVSIDMKHRSIKLTSFLRDTWVYIPTLGYNQRLNAACSSGGYEGVVDAIEYNFGVDIDGYAVVDFEMFKVLVDSLGGVEVDVTEAEANEVTNHPYRYGDVVLESGKYKLSGEQALAYCRIRKIDTDFVRTERQRTVMSAILNNAKHSNPFTLLNMAYKSAPYIETDLTKSELRSLVMRAVPCLGNDIQQAKVPFEGTWEYATISGNSVISINTDSNKQKLMDYIYNDVTD